MISPAEWQQIYDAIAERQMRREIAIGFVIKNDPAKKLVWLDEFGDVGIPLVAFDFLFDYYDSRAVSVAGSDVVSIVDVKQRNRVQIKTPDVGQQVVVLKPWGELRLPICIGRFWSTGHWEGDV